MHPLAEGTCFSQVEGALRRHVPVRVWSGADYPTERYQVLAFAKLLLPQEYVVHPGFETVLPIECDAEAIGTAVDAFRARYCYHQ